MEIISGEVPINLTTAILGEKVVIPTLDGKVELKYQKAPSPVKYLELKIKE